MYTLYYVDLSCSDAFFLLSYKIIREFPKLVYAYAVIASTKPRETLHVRLDLNA